jgi:hypothetical protein
VAPIIESNQNVDLTATAATRRAPIAGISSQKQDARVASILNSRALNLSVRSMTPVTVRSSALGRLAAFLLVVLIVSPFTAPFSTLSGELQASPSGPADSVNSETKQTTDALVTVTFVHVEWSWSVVAYRPLPPGAIAELTHVNRILRL